MIVGVLVARGRFVRRLVAVSLCCRCLLAVAAGGWIGGAGVAGMAGLCLDQQITTMLGQLKHGGDEVDRDHRSDASQRPG